MSLATISDMRFFCVAANKPHSCCLSHHVYNNKLFVFYCVSKSLLIEHIASDVGS